MTEANTADKQQLAYQDTQSEKHIEDTQDQCKNCRTPLTGPFCHQCGQPAKSIIRFFGSLIHELLEDIINLDSRAARTLVALLFRPGFLTREYVSGRRFSYVPPLRLFLITSLFCIAVIWVLNKTSESNPDIQVVGQPVTSTKGKLGETERQQILHSLADKPLSQLNQAERQKARQKLDSINNAFKMSGLETIPLPEELLTDAERNLEAVNDVEKDDELDSHGINDDLSVVEKQHRETEKSEQDQLSSRSDSGLNINDNGKITVNFPFLSEEDNRQLEEKFTEKFKKLKDPDEREDFFGDLLELVPKTMLLFVPIFAIFMKLSYPFARRYYIEHLIHAFHGHAFLFLSIVLIIALNLLDESLGPSDNWLLSFIGGVAGFLQILLFIWIPVYFLLTLRKVYQQHWVLTVMKWMVLGIVYLMLFTFSSILVLVLSVLYN